MRGQLLGMTKANAPIESPIQPPIRHLQVRTAPAKNRHCNTHDSPTLSYRGRNSPGKHGLVDDPPKEDFSWEKPVMENGRFTRMVGERKSEAAQPL